MLDDSDDTVVCTCTLCSIHDPVATLHEVRRVLKSDGQFLFCEQGCAPGVSLAHRQQRIKPLSKPMVGGSHLTLHTPSFFFCATPGCRFRSSKVTPVARKVPTITIRGRFAKPEEEKRLCQGIYSFLFSLNC